MKRVAEKLTAEDLTEAKARAESFIAEYGKEKR
jgi:hypothetical protein